MRLSLAALVATIATTLGGCGEVAYKMGGGADQYRQDQTACRASDDTAYEACMKAKGWTVIGSETPAAGDGAMAATSPAAPAQSTAVTATTQPAAHSTLNNAKPPLAEQPTAGPQSPNDTVTVTSWWKFGATDFKGDAHACTDTLGAEHRYDETKHITTRAFVGCMAKKGWHAL